MRCCWAEELGNLTTNDGKNERDIERRVHAGNKVNRALLAIMNSKSISRQARFGIHNEVFIPTLIYGSESWVWQKKNESRINEVEMRSLRSICGVSQKDRCRNSYVRKRCGLKEDAGTVVLHTGLTDEGRGRTEIYSEDLGVGLGPMLGNYVGNRVLNICMPGASYADILNKTLLGKHSENTLIITLLDQTHLREVKDIIVNPPTTGKYEILKTELVKRLSDSKERKLKQLLMHKELGDRKPSQFFRHLQGLAVIAGQTAPTLELLADLADRVHEIALPSLQVASTSTVSAHASTLENLTSEIAELKAAVITVQPQIDVPGTCGANAQLTPGSGPLRTSRRGAAGSDTNSPGPSRLPRVRVQITSQTPPAQAVEVAPDAHGDQRRPS
ncbi:hypothetical protein EVAR_2411_1 [Eumeta japonica]|uniref:DUF7041 domain-containing protein n=1 Tax=Eumeta variegata TaxID=151549 RepID=A0A4C1SR07_EUMVA|nr:hypothetical protein EVAR_2411_1 [Eumeta japonica]